MIEVTLGMVYSILEWAENDNAGRSELNGAIRRIIELHEQSKPKPEPVGEVSFWNGTHYADGLWDNYPVGTKLYTLPHTQEPLSEEIVSSWSLGLSAKYGCDISADCLINIVRETETAHGIGVTK